MKKFALLIIILGLGFGAWQLLATKPDGSTPQAVVTPDTSTDTPPKEITDKKIAVLNELVTISFKGFGPGKVHNGSFTTIKSALGYTDIALTGTITVSMDSLASDNEKLTEHLKSSAFFDVVKYPTATFVPKNITGADAQGAEMTGAMTIHGITKNITFPVQYKKVIPAPNVKMAYTESYVSTFTLNMKEFGINQTFANETIELTVTVPIINK